ncbi:MAG: queuosine precursor transporter [Spirochaetaceae bacterium]|nr:queuosine precursor transporter [Spirochaetaceae bacterium]
MLKKNFLKTKEKIPLEKFLYVTTIVYILLMVASNVMASKVLAFGGLVIDAGTLTYPLTFMIGDLLAELFGYKRTANVILWGFAGNFLFCLCALAGAVMPALDPNDPITRAYDTLFTYNLRIVGASFGAYLAGALVNAGSLVLIRRLTGPKWLGFRTIGSTALGALVDTALFTGLAWAFTLPGEELFRMIYSGYAVKMLYEIIIATPLDYALSPLIRKRVRLPT